MTNIADIHCHIIPYVDDGALDKDISRELIDAQQEQGVSAVCCTPHLRRGMFETPDEVIQEQFARLKARAAETHPQLRFWLSREYHADSLLLQTLESRKILPLGPDHLLLEMSNRASEEEMMEYIETVRHYGYRVLLAHPERYEALQRDWRLARRLAEAGAKLQLNTSSILGREGLGQKLLCRRLLKEQLVYCVASDAHDPEERPVELDRAAAYLTRRAGPLYTQQLLSRNPLAILEGTA